MLKALVATNNQMLQLRREHILRHLIDWLLKDQNQANNHKEAIYNESINRMHKMH